MGVAPEELLDPKDSAPPLFSLNDGTTEWRLAEQLLDALIDGLHRYEDRWNEKLARNVFEDAELDETRASYNAWWEAYEPLIIPESHRIRAGESELPRALQDKVSGAFHAFFAADHALAEASQKRGRSIEAPTELRRAGSQGA